MSNKFVKNHFSTLSNDKEYESNLELNTDNQNKF